MDLQIAGIREFATVAGYDVVGAYSDVASARHHDNLLKRPSLLSALQAAEQQKAVLIVYDWSRLTRYEADMEKITALLPASRILAVDDGENLARASKAGQLARAEKLGDEIVKRTKEGMARKKAQGVQYGNPNILVTQPAGVAAAQAHARSVREAVADVLEDLSSLDNDITNKALADELNARGILTGQHKRFDARKAAYVRNDAEDVLANRRARPPALPTLPAPAAVEEGWQKPPNWGRF